MKTIGIILLSSGFFTILFNKLHKIYPEIFNFIDKIPDTFKGRWSIRWMVLVFLMTIVSIIVVASGLNDTLGKIIVGFLIALTDLAFKKTL